MVCVAVISAHMMAAFYRHIIKTQGNFSTQMSISGPVTCTGKSLMQTSCIYMFNGVEQPTMTSLTEATFYEILSGGSNIFGKYGLCYVSYLIACFSEGVFSQEVV